MAGWTNKLKAKVLDWVFRGTAQPTNFYVALVTSTTAPTQDINTLGELTEIAAGNGYVTGGISLSQIEKFRRGQRRSQHFQHGVLEIRKPRPVFRKQGNELIHLLRSDGTTPDSSQELSQHFTTIYLLVAFVVALNENVGMGFRRPLLVERSADFNGLDKNMERFFPAVCIGDTAYVQELIPSWKRCGQFPERVTLDVTQRNIEVDELRVVCRCRDRDVTLTDHLGEIGVVAGVGTENQT